MTQDHTSYQIELPLDPDSAGKTAAAEVCRQALHARIHRALASGDTTGTSLLLQLATLQALERIEEGVGEGEPQPPPRPSPCSGSRDQAAVAGAVGCRCSPQPTGTATAGAASSRGD